MSTQTLSFKDEAIIIFVRHPELGKVKTRLAKTIGNDKALRVYEQLLQHTLEVTMQLSAPKFIFYTNEIQKVDIWSNPGYWKCKQKGDDLGERMKNAFSFLFEQGFKRIVIIGSDCFQLTRDLIFKAFAALNNEDVVLGPAADGGYYLLGMNTLYPDFFEDKVWSGDHVASKTIEDAKRLELNFALLETLYDIDEFEDLEKSGFVLD